MAASIPVIGTPVGGIVDFLVDNKTGLVSKVEDSNDLAEKIDYILTHSDKKEVIIKNAKFLVEKNYSWGIVANKMDKIFNNIRANKPLL